MAASATNRTAIWPALKANRVSGNRLEKRRGCRLRCRWRRLARPLGYAQSEKLTDIDHFGLTLGRCFTKAINQRSNPCNNSHRLVRVRPTMSTYHVDWQSLPPATLAGLSFARVPERARLRAAGRSAADAPATVDDAKKSRRVKRPREADVDGFDARCG